MTYKKDHFKRIFVLLKEINNENRKIKGVFVDDYLGNLEDIKNAKELGYWKVFLPKQFLPKTIHPYRRNDLLLSSTQNIWLVPHGNR
ncbi:hypothetical protein B1F79_01425 [Coxiella-like endosymbiont of Rhipicephalus sanguineus]|uniref:hypothetical protein n=1 Tax=Coxiella-like endosymbiont of Rhipicephalus sanguineus TaxID=1955402 RepID=UPI00203E69A3|nr:hypothetical protein [Coxiella-like endosymbiont of Rhipicephalus sanguineus]MBT8506354.1 hypothetical protein [Coxiella-like endosymbiont of Rhipicephalus sanguineus]